MENQIKRKGISGFYTGQRLRYIKFAREVRAAFIRGGDGLAPKEGPLLDILSTYLSADSAYLDHLRSKGVRAEEKVVAKRWGDVLAKHLVENDGREVHEGDGDD